MFSEDLAQRRVRPEHNFSQDVRQFSSVKKPRFVCHNNASEATVLLLLLLLLSFNPFTTKKFRKS